MLDDLLKAYPWFEHAEGIKFVEIERNAHRSIGHWLFLPGTRASFHRVRNTDEIWAIHVGRLLLHVLAPSGEHRQMRLGFTVAAGEVPVATVPAGHWQAAEILPGESYAFGSNVCAPPFAYSEWELGTSVELARAFPQHAALIARLTRHS